MAGDLTGIQQIHVSVTDVEASVAFYRDILGLEHLFTVPGRPVAFFDSGGVRLYLAVPEDEAYRSRPVIYYAVDDLEAAYARTIGRGAPSLSAPTMVHREADGELWIAFVSDPDGTPVGLSEQRAASPV